MSVELQVMWDFEDNYDIIFLFLSKTIVGDPSLEPSRQETTLKYKLKSALLEASSFLKGETPFWKFLSPREPNRMSQKSSSIEIIAKMVAI